MQKDEVINYLADYKQKIREMGKFNGKASLLRSLGKDIQFLQRNKVGGNIPQLIMNKYNKIDTSKKQQKQEPLF